MPRTNYAALGPLESVAIGQKVCHRTWTVPAGDMPQRPVIDKRAMYVRAIHGEAVYAYSPSRGSVTEYRLWELVGVNPSISAGQDHA